MAGELEELQGALDRALDLEQALGRTADPAERQILAERLEQAKSEWVAVILRVKAAASAGDRDAKAVFDAFRTALTDDE